MVLTGQAAIADLERASASGERYELMRGELRRMAPAGGEHGEVGTEFVFHLRAHVGRVLGRVYNADTGFILARSPDTVLAPDAAFVRADRLPAPSDRRGFLPVVPDLVVEVVSPWDRPRDVEEKVALYLQSGVRLVWLVHPARRTVTVYAPNAEPRVLGPADTLDGGDVLPGFRLPVAALFDAEQPSADAG